MASTYSTRLRLELMGSGDQSGTWGTTTNTNLGTLIEAAIAGRAAVSMTDADYTLTVANGTTDEARNMILNISGALTATRNVICPTVSKMYIVKNATTGGQSIIFKTSAGTGVTIENGLTSLVFCDGTNVVEGITRFPFTNLTIAGNALFSSAGARIQGDFSNATLANRTAFQDKTTNNLTFPTIIPNGTSSNAGIGVFNSSDPSNAAYGSMSVDASKVQLAADKSGSGTYLPLAFNTNNTEAARIDTSGNLLVGTTNANGLVSNLKKTVGGIFSTISGSVSAATAAGTGLFTLPNVSMSMWIISVQLTAADTANYSALAIVATQNASLRFMLNTPGALLTLANGGLTIEATQNSGGTASIFYSAIRIM